MSKKFEAMARNLMTTSTVFFRTRSIKPFERYVPEPFNTRSPHRSFKRSSRTPSQSQPVERLKAIRRAVWEKQFGKAYEGKCITRWCNHVMDVWTFQVAHDVARSLGGSNELSNLYPMCPQCNESMGTTTLEEWNSLGVNKMNESIDVHSKSSRKRKRED
jgi:5-methylcytosine-specific restriction endonuclease McrA